MATEHPTVAVTMGDPAGIGPEITLDALARDEVHEAARLVVLGDLGHLRSLADDLGVVIDLRRVGTVEKATVDGPVDVIDFDNVGEVTHGELDASNGRASLEYVDRSIELARSGTVHGLANAPIHKEAIALAGSEYAGHTDLMAARTGTDQYTALLTDGVLCVTHVSLHVPLERALEAVTTESVLETVRVTDDLLPEVGIENPTLGVLGVNPHAGDGGVIGDRDIREIEPAVERAREEGIDAEGPLPPDSAFNLGLAGQYDCMVAMYHDQGHIPLFVNSYVEGGGVEATAITLGFPFVRATTLHGTAYDIAGQGIAAPDSMIATIEVVTDAVQRRNRW